MKTLIINTANDKLLVVLNIDNKVFYKINESRMHHNETMLPLIDELLTENNIKIQDIQEFGVVIGPGSFTGIRVGIATIKAFRDSLGVEAKGINNLDYLFALARHKNPEIETVAICGSKDSYFVAKYVLGKVYKYERNISCEELKQISQNKPIGMFKKDENLNCIELEDNAEVLLECLNASSDETLIPVYYQLSQAENEKLKRGEIIFIPAEIEDKEKILKIEQNNILINTLNEKDIKQALIDTNYKTFKANFNDEIVGFIVTQLTDEANIVSIAVNKEFRNLGIASRLISKVEEYCVNKNINTISLEVAYDNITAYLLYQKLGFKQRRVRKNYYQNGADCIEMFKQLN